MYGIKIEDYKFDRNLPGFLKGGDFYDHLWPVVYILDKRKIKLAYIGETTDAIQRLNAHLKDTRKQEMSSVNIITSRNFHKSATLDIESALIRYFQGDGFKLLNGNLGVSNHSYPDKEAVQKGIHVIWEQLREKKIVSKTLAVIENSDIYKFSPYKSLDHNQIKSVLSILEVLNDPTKKTALVEGGAGTGKSVLAVFLCKLLVSDPDELVFRDLDGYEGALKKELRKFRAQYPNPKIGYVIPVSSFRKTMEKVFRSIHQLNSKMVIGPAELGRNSYDILFVDESHRLRRQKNIGTYVDRFRQVCKTLGFDSNKATELDWVLKQSEKAVLFYDRGQSVRPTDVEESDFDKLENNKTSTKKLTLISQFRCKGGVDYIKFVSDLLDVRITDKTPKFDPNQYDLRLYKSPQKMWDDLKKLDAKHGLCRIVAGFSWKWVTKNKAGHDIKIGNFKIRWNKVTVDWVNSPNAVNEAGCIHTTQGYDFNYTGIMFGKEIGYDPIKEQIIIRRSEYEDKVGKQGVEDDKQLKRYILNIYKTMMYRGIKGTFVYAVDEELNLYLSKFINGY